MTTSQHSMSSLLRILPTTSNLSKCKHFGASLRNRIVCGTQMHTLVEGSSGVSEVSLCYMSLNHAANTIGWEDTRENICRPLSSWCLSSQSPMLNEPHFFYRQTFPFQPVKCVSLFPCASYTICSLLCYLTLSVDRLYSPSTSSDHKQ